MCLCVRACLRSCVYVYVRVVEDAGVFLCMNVCT